MSFRLCYIFGFIFFLSPRQILHFHIHSTMAYPYPIGVTIQDIVRERIKLEELRARAEKCAENKASLEGKSNDGDRKLTSAVSTTGDMGTQPVPKIPKSAILPHELFNLHLSEPAKVNPGPVVGLSTERRRYPVPPTPVFVSSLPPSSSVSILNKRKSDDSVQPNPAKRARMAKHVTFAVDLPSWKSVTKAGNRRKAATLPISQGKTRELHPIKANAEKLSSFKEGGGQSGVVATSSGTPSLPPMPSATGAKMDLDPK